MRYFFTKKQIIKALAEDIADCQRKADKFFYIMHDQSMSSFCCDRVAPLKDLAIRLGICKEVYDEAHTIYDFRNSGKEGYTLRDGKIVKEV